jgi:hypothetical protein
MWKQLIHHSKWKMSKNTKCHFGLELDLRYKLRFTHDPVTTIVQGGSMYEVTTVEAKMRGLRNVAALLAAATATSVS